MVPCEFATPNMHSETHEETACGAKSMALVGALKVIRRLNRNTTWVATGLVGPVIFAGLMVALREQHAKTVDDANSVALFKHVDLSEKRSVDEIASGHANSVDHAFTEISPQGNPSFQMDAAALAPAPGVALALEINHHDVQSNEGSWNSAHDQDSGRVIEVKVPRARFRASVRRRIVGVKARLIALWHQSLFGAVPKLRSRRWTLFANSNKWARKKVSYTAETNH